MLTTYLSEFICVVTCNSTVVIYGKTRLLPTHFSLFTFSAPQIIATFFALALRIIHLNHITFWFLDFVFQFTLTCIRNSTIIDLIDRFINLTLIFGLSF